MNDYEIRKFQFQLFKFYIKIDIKFELNCKILLYIICIMLLFKN